MAKFDEKIEIMKNLASDLVQYNFPMGPVEMEYHIAPLKKCEVEVDGYTIVFHFNRALYQDHYLETFQLYNKYAPFLPFHLVAKLAKKVLGGHFLSLIEFYQEDRKVYCWSVCLDIRGRPIMSPIKEKTVTMVFEGFEYMYMNPEQLNLY
jgi:hypothetical protein